MKRTILRIPGVNPNPGFPAPPSICAFRRGYGQSRCHSVTGRSGGHPTKWRRINAARIAGKTDDEIRALVAKLEAARKDAMEWCDDGCCR